MQTAIIQGVKNCLPLGLADGAVSTDPSPTRQKGCRRPTSWARTGSMMLFSTATNLRLGFFARGLFQLTPLTNMWTRRTKPRRKPRLPWLTTEKLPSSTSRHYFWQIHRKRGSRIAFIENAIHEWHFSKSLQPPVTPCAVDTYNLVSQKTWRVNSQFLRWKFA